MLSECAGPFGNSDSWIDCWEPQQASGLFFGVASLQCAARSRRRQQVQGFGVPSLLGLLFKQFQNIRRRATVACPSSMIAPCNVLIVTARSPSRLVSKSSILSEATQSPGAAPIVVRRARPAARVEIARRRGVPAPAVAMAILGEASVRATEIARHARCLTSFVLNAVRSRRFPSGLATTAPCTARIATRNCNNASRSPSPGC